MYSSRRCLRKYKNTKIADVFIKAVSPKTEIEIEIGIELGIKLEIEFGIEIEIEFGIERIRNPTG